MFLSAINVSSRSPSARSRTSQANWAEKRSVHKVREHFELSSQGTISTTGKRLRWSEARQVQAKKRSVHKVREHFELSSQGTISTTGKRLRWSEARQVQAKKRSVHKVREHFWPELNEASDRLKRFQPHLESPQDRQVLHPSIIITAAVLHLAQSCAPSG